MGKKMPGCLRQSSLSAKMQIMKRKVQHNAVNNQEDEDSCTYPICFPSDAPVEKKEGKSEEESSGPLFSEASGNKDELTSNRQ
jgi:hypothetical protein